MTNIYNKIINSITSNNLNRFNKLLKNINKDDKYLDIYIISNLQIIFNNLNNHIILKNILNIILDKNNYIYFLDIISNLPENYKIINYDKYVLIHYIIKKNNTNINNSIILLNILNIKMLNFIYNIDNNLFADILSNKLLYGSYINIILTLIVLINLKLNNNINLNNYNILNNFIKDINTDTYLTIYIMNNIYNNNINYIDSHFMKIDNYQQNIYDIFNNDEIRYKNDIIIDGIIFMLLNNDKLLFKYTFLNNKSILINYKLIYCCLYYYIFDFFNILLLNLFNSLLVDIYELTDYSSNITSIYFLIKFKKDKLEKCSNEYIYIKKLLNSIKSNTYII